MVSAVRARAGFSMFRECSAERSHGIQRRIETQTTTRSGRETLLCGRQSESIAHETNDADLLLFCKRESPEGHRGSGSQDLLIDQNRGSRARPSGTETKHKTYRCGLVCRVCRLSVKTPAKIPTGQPLERKVVAKVLIASDVATSELPTRDSRSAQESSRLVAWIGKR